MQTIPTTSYRAAQKLHPLNLLAQLTSRQTNGCLQVASGSTTWSIYLEQGRLVYASSSIDPFERLDRHLRRLSAQVPTLVSAIRVQVRLLFESALETQTTICRDYQAVCWLVNQQHLAPNQAALLIEEIAKEVIESFLSVKEGTHKLLNSDQLESLPKFCQLDLRPLVEYCQSQLRRRQPPIAALPTVNPTGNRNVTSAAGAEQTLPFVMNPKAEGRFSQGGAALAPTSKTTYTIACIDDSPTVLQAIKSFLDDKSFSVLMINNPVQALMQIVRNKPDLILLDVEMPNLDGYELCSLLRRHPSFKQTPIIMVTGNTGFVDRAKAKLVRASGYLTKPFNQSDLLKMVFKHLT
jgi:twitching motility two-component system response regulator PilG